MDAYVVLSFAASVVLLIVYAIVGIQLARGRWLTLLAGRTASIEDADQSSLRTLGKRMAVVLLTAFILVVTLLVYEASVVTKADSVAWVASMANNVAFVALVVAVIWFFIMQWPGRGKEVGQPAVQARRARATSLDYLHTATIAFVVCLLASVFAVGILFAVL